MAHSCLSRGGRRTRWKKHSRCGRTSANTVACANICCWRLHGVSKGTTHRTGNPISMRDSPRRTPPPSSSNCLPPCAIQASEQPLMPGNGLGDFLRLVHCDPTGCHFLFFIGSTRAAAGIGNLANTTKHSSTATVCYRPPQRRSHGATCA